MRASTLTTALALALLLSSRAAHASDGSEASERPTSEHAEERPGRFELGFRTGGGAPYHLRSSDRNKSLVVSFVLGGSVGARVTKAVSLAVEPMILLQPTMASTLVAYSYPPGTKPPPGAPSMVAVLSPTIGLHPSRYLAVTLGPSVAAGPTVMAGGTARLALQLPVGRAGLRLSPGVETWALGGSGVSLATLVGTFGVDL